MTLVIALMSLVLLSAFGTSLAVVTNTELRASANYATSRETMYAADGALQIAARELLSVADWNVLLSSGALSAFVDGPPGGVRQLGDGTTVDLAEATSAANASRARGAQQSRVAIVCLWMAGPRTYVVAWAADDPAETDGDPSTDGGGAANPGAGILALRAEAFGPGGAHKVLEATVRRDVEPGGGPVVRVLSWQEAR